MKESVSNYIKIQPPSTEDKTLTKGSRFKKSRSKERKKISATESKYDILFNINVGPLMLFFVLNESFMGINAKIP